MLEAVSPIVNRGPNKLYHLTVSKKWAAIQESKALKSFPDFMDSGVFFFDMDNAVNVWDNAMVKGDCKNCLNHLWDVIVAKIKPADKPAELVLLEVSADNLQPLKARDISLFKAAQDTFEKTDIPLGEKITRFYPEFVGGINHNQMASSDLKSLPLEFIYTGNVNVNLVKEVARFKQPVNDSTSLERLFVENVSNKGQIQQFFEKLLKYM